MAPSTVIEILNKTAEYFRQKGVPNARLDAQLILAHCLGLKRLDLYLNFDRPLLEAELAICREAVRRRSNREPLQHIIGEWPFRQLSLKVDARALIPRPETEVLVDLVLRALPAGTPATVVDIGVGTGAIALSLRKERGNLQVYGTDLSSEAIALCQENATRNQLATDGFFSGSLLSPLPTELPIDLIVSNPPYIGRHEFQELQPEVRDFDPAMALIGGEQGWELPFELMQAAFLRLSSGGSLIMEVASPQIPILSAKAEAMGWVFCGSEKDWSGYPRFINMRK